MSHIFSRKAISPRIVALLTPISYFLRRDFDPVKSQVLIYSSTIIFSTFILRASIFLVI